MVFQKFLYRNNLNLINKITTKNKFQKIDKLESCKRYFIIISLPGTYGISFKLSTSDKIKPPKNVIYNKDIKELTWNYTISCIPYVFYVI